MKKSPIRSFAAAVFADTKRAAIGGFIALFGLCGVALAVQTINDSLTVTGGINQAGGFTATANLIHTGGVPAQVSTAGTDATPVVTEFYYAQIYVPSNTLVTGVALMNGSVASGNIKVGIADANGNQLATSASTAMSGTDAYQRISLANTLTLVGPATYYVEEFIDNTTARYNTHTFGDFRAAKVTAQVYATGFTNFTPATTFTTALGPIASLF